MKKYFIKWIFIAICIFSTISYAQVTNSGMKDYTQSMDDILTNVSKTSVTTGILYDRVMSFSDLSMIKDNGAITKSNYQHFIQSWSELNRASYGSTFATVDNLKNSIESNINPDMVELGIINTKMNYIDFGLPTQPSLTTANGLLYNVAGINPILEKQITIISPLKEKINSGTITFRILPSFMLQLTGSPIKNLIVNFGTATNYNLITNQVITATNPVVSFSTSGLKEFTFTVTFVDNITETLKATMFVEVPPIISNSPQSLVASYPLEENFVGTTGITTASTGNVAFQGYNETTPAKGVLEYRTYYNRVTNNGSSASKIKKEILILDGYDPGDGRKIYPESTGYKEDKRSLYESMYYDDDNNPATISANLVEKLRAAPYGFDVTLVNFPNGADYVERNSMALVALLQRENAKLLANGSNEQISIIGPSMGGLVSRYALAYMEKNNIPHNTKLWVSFDSPHLGANIPVGAQENLYFYGYKGRKDRAKIKFDENFRSPAARQMLIEQLDFAHEQQPFPTDLMPNGNVANGCNNNTPFRQQFISSLNSNGIVGSNGFPQNLRKISLLNGTSTGSKTNGEGQMFLEMAAFKRIRSGLIFGLFGGLLPIYTNIKVATIEDRFLGTPNSQSQTFAGKATFFAGWNNNFPEVVNSTTVRTNSNPRGSMDNVQGGWFNTQGIIKDEFTPDLQALTSFHEWRQYLPNHAFIPSVSALAFKNPNFDWSTAFMRNLVCNPANKEIFFDSYFIPPTNEEHVKVNAENAKWLIEELQGNNQLPYFPMEDNLLTGDNIICENQLKTFTINETCKVPGAPVWSVTGNLQIVSSTPFSVTVKGLSNSPSEGKIIATFHSFVGGQKIEKIVHIGAPSVSNLRIGGTFDWVSTFSGSVGIGVAPDPTTTSYIWSVSYDPLDMPLTCPAINPRKAKFQGGTTVGFVNSLATTSPNASIDYGNCVGSYIVTCTAINACGSTDYIQKETFVGPPSSNPCTHPKTGFKLSIAPNPVKDGQINVSLSRTIDMVPCNYLNNGNKQALKLNPIEEVIENKALIYDLFGNLVYSKTFITDEFTLTDINLKRGHYILNVFTSKGESSKQVIIVE